MVFSYNLKSSNTITIEYAYHRQQAVIKLLFKYDSLIISRVKQLDGIRWSKTMNCWYIPNNAETLKLLSQNGIIIEEKTITNKTHETLQKKINPNNFEVLLTRFGNYMKERRYSPRTIEVDIGTNRTSQTWASITKSYI